jgi:uncharacterized protein (TIGR01777 family)
MKKILIAGGTGFIGKLLCHELKNQGYIVSILSRSNNIHVPYRIYQWKPSKNEMPLQSLVNEDIIINIAGTNIAGGRWTAKRKASILKSRIDSTRLLVSTIIENKLAPGLFINASAIGFYGNRPGEELTEDSEKGKDFLSNVCAAWERELIPLEEYGIPVAIMRFGLVLSNNGGIFPSLIRPVRLGLDVRFENGRQYLSWIHVDDLINCIIWLLKGKLHSGIYNCVAPQPVSQMQFNYIAGNILNKRTLAVKISKKLLKIILGEVSDLLLTDQYVIPIHLQEQYYTFIYNSINDALIALLLNRKQELPD